MAGGPCAAREHPPSRAPVDRGRARESLARDIARLAASLHTVGARIARLQPELVVVAMDGGSDGGRQWPSRSSSDGRRQRPASSSTRKRSARQERSARRAETWWQRRRVQGQQPKAPEAPKAQEAGGQEEPHEARRTPGGDQPPEEAESRARASALGQGRQQSPAAARAAAAGAKAAAVVQVAGAGVRQGTDAAVDEETAEAWAREAQRHQRRVRAAAGLLRWPFPAAADVAGHIGARAVAATPVAEAGAHEQDADAAVDEAIAEAWQDAAARMEARQQLAAAASGQQQQPAVSSSSLAATSSQQPAASSQQPAASS